MLLTVAISAIVLATAALALASVALHLVNKRGGEAAAARESAATSAGVTALANERLVAERAAHAHTKRLVVAERRRATVLEEELHVRDNAPAMPRSERTARNRMLAAWREAAVIDVDAVEVGAGPDSGSGGSAGTLRDPAAAGGDAAAAGRPAPGR